MASEECLKKFDEKLQETEPMWFGEVTCYKPEERVTVLYLVALMPDGDVHVIGAKADGQITKDRMEKIRSRGEELEWYDPGPEELCEVALNTASLFEGMLAAPSETRH